MSELIDRAQALIPSLIGTAYGLPADARGWTDRPGEGSVPNNVCTDAADTLAELLAENQRQAEELRQHAEYIPALTDRMMEAEVAFANERVATIELQHRAEARLRELASAEPVACISPAELAHLKRSRSAIVIPADSSDADDVILIRRPEMPK